ENRILEGKKKSFHTLHFGLGVRCLPLHTLLHYIDTGVLHLTETCVGKLLKDLDDTEKNEKLKFSIVMRLPEVTNDFGCNFLDFGIDRKFLRVHRINSPMPERLSVPVEFLPLNYLTNMLAEIENQGVHPYEKQDHVNVRFVEETALKHTMTFLGLKYS
uniref:Gamma-secretase-activating protein C-terminal domain-containing protein n=1 Tax=Buteo japonicus TaxID=224669 RepID=A0A8C0BY06_9AVES